MFALVIKRENICIFQNSAKSEVTKLSINISNGQIGERYHLLYDFDK